MLCVLRALLLCAALAAPPSASDLDVVWDSPNAESSGSIPISNGDLAANFGSSRMGRF
jgi:hypothetical protein